MNRKLLLLLVCLSVSTLWTQAQVSIPIDSVGYLLSQPVTIKQMGSSFVLEPMGTTGKRYLPVNLSTRYRINGAEAMVTGIIGRIPPNMRLMGTPLEIKHISPLRSIGTPNGGMITRPTPTPDRGGTITNNKGVALKEMISPRSSDGSIGTIGNDSKVVVGTGGKTPVKVMPPTHGQTPVRGGGQVRATTPVKPWTKVERPTAPVSRPKAEIANPNMNMGKINTPNNPNPNSASKLTKIRWMKKLNNATGTIVQLPSGAFVVEMGGKQYAPTNLPADYKVNGLAVVFSGDTGIAPPAMGLSGTPLRVSTITKKTTPDPNKQKWQFWQGHNRR